MKIITEILCFTAITIGIISCQQQNAAFIDLEGKALSRDEMKASKRPYLQVLSSQSSRGTIVFYSGREPEDDSIATNINQMGFSVAALKGNNIGMTDAIKAFRLIQSNSELKLNTGYTCIIGCSNGGKMAALTTYELKEDERPDDLILIHPAHFDETRPGTVFPVVNPPLTTKTKLLCITDSLIHNKTEIKAAIEYTKTWIGYDGVAFHKKITYAQEGHSKNKELNNLLTSFWNGKMDFPKDQVNPAAQAVEGYSPQRHAEKTALVKNHKYDLLFVGNSITNNFEKPEFQPVWQKYFGSRNAINLGYSGYRTENIIWNIQNGELENQTPKVIILEIGTNNIDEKNYPTRHTAGQLAEGMEKIVQIFREKCPDSKIILLRCFPGCYGGPNPTSHRRILERASDVVSHLADNKHIFYCDINHVFLNMDGSINHELMPDWLHPNPEGAELWAQAMEPLLSKLMEDKSHDDKKPVNTAIIPTSKLEEDNYDWWVRHNDVLHVKDSLNPEIILIGNFITHFWGGHYPQLKYADGTSREPNGPNSGRAVFGAHRVLNLGFGWVRTQNVGFLRKEVTSDLCHPTDAGYKIWGEAFQPYIKHKTNYTK